MDPASVRTASAPRQNSKDLEIPNQRIIDVEHPCLVKNLDKGFKSLGGEGSIWTFLNYELVAREVAEARARDEEAITAKRRKEAKESSKPQPQVSFEDTFKKTYQDFLKEIPPKQIGVSLRPEDPYAKAITSKSIQVHDLLFKITLPRRTGRKRKRGSDGPWQEDPNRGDYVRTDINRHQNIFPRALLQDLRANGNNYTITPLGTITESHRFRTLPDFHYSIQPSNLVTQLNTHIFPFTYEALDGFALDPSADVKEDMPFPLPNRFSQHSLPFNYGYCQNATVRQIVDGTGSVQTLNTASRNVAVPIAVQADVEEVPQGPLDTYPPLDTSHPTHARLYKDIQELFQKRPIWTRRALLNHLPREDKWTARLIVPYVGYIFKSGPFRDTIVKYGLDPRKEAKHREYQTLMFQLEGRKGRPTKHFIDPKKMRTTWRDGRVKHAQSGEETEARDTHIFDGKKVDRDGKVFQFVDVTDPIVKKLIDEAPVTEKFDIYAEGWYHSGTLCKVRTIMKEKITCMIEGDEIDDGHFKAVIDWVPDTTADAEMWAFNQALQKLYRPDNETLTNAQKFFLQRTKELIKQMSKSRENRQELLKSVGKGPPEGGKATVSKAAAPAETGAAPKDVEMQDDEEQAEEPDDEAEVDPMREVEDEDENENEDEEQEMAQRREHVNTELAAMRARIQAAMRAAQEDYKLVRPKNTTSNGSGKPSAVPGGIDPIVQEESPLPDEDIIAMETEDQELGEDPMDENPEDIAEEDLEGVEEEEEVMDEDQEDYEDYEMVEEEHPMAEGNKSRSG